MQSYTLQQRLLQWRDQERHHRQVTKGILKDLAGHFPYWVRCLRIRLWLSASFHFLAPFRRLASLVGSVLRS